MFFRRFKKKVIDSNILQIIDEDGNIVNKDISFYIHGLSININGERNKIILHRPYKFNHCTIVINGNGNLIEIGKISISINHTYFCMEPCSDNREIIIGDNTYIGQAKLMCFGTNNHLHIGRDCLLSSGIHIRTGDAHAVIDYTTKELLNKNGDVIIGDHCWFGIDSFVSKNIHIPNNTIIGAKAGVFKTFTEEFTAIGGVPAKVIKRNVEWLLQSDDSYYYALLQKEKNNDQNNIY